jgi:hypothetical protein
MSGVREWRVNVWVLCQEDGVHPSTTAPLAAATPLQCRPYVADCVVTFVRTCDAFLCPAAPSCGPSQTHSTPTASQWTDPSPMRWAVSCCAVLCCAAGHSVLCCAVLRSRSCCAVLCCVPGHAVAVLCCTAGHAVPCCAAHQVMLCRAVLMC